MEDNVLVEMLTKAFEDLTGVGEKLQNGTYETRDISVEELCMISDSLDVIMQLVIAVKDQVLESDKEAQEACMSQITKEVLKLKNNL